MRSGKLFFCLFALMVAFMVGTTTAWAVLPSRLFIEAETQGTIEGDGPEGSITVFSFEHGITQPIDRNGVAKGRRQHKPISILKGIDKSSTRLYLAATSGEVLLRVNLKIFQNDASGIPNILFTISLKNARIVRLVQSSPKSLLAESEQYKMPVESVTFAYEAIIWEHSDGTFASDTWRTEN